MSLDLVSLGKSVTDNTIVLNDESSSPFAFWFMTFTLLLWLDWDTPFEDVHDLLANEVDIDLSSDELGLSAIVLRLSSDDWEELELEEVERWELGKVEVYLGWVWWNEFEYWDSTMSEITDSDWLDPGGPACDKLDLELEGKELMEPDAFLEKVAFACNGLEFELDGREATEFFFDKEDVAVDFTPNDNKFLGAVIQTVSGGPAWETLDLEVEDKVEVSMG